MTVDGKNVVAFTPYGRERTVSILAEYMKRDHDRGILDEWWLCMNTDPQGQEADIEYAHRLAGEHDFIKCVERPQHHPDFNQWHQHKQMYTRLFYIFMTDRNSVYLRFDDDIVYVHPEAINRLVYEKVCRPRTLGLFPIIWNNAICSWHLQQRGIIPERFGRVRAAYCMDEVGWADSEFAIRIHHQLLDHIEANTVEELFMYQDVQLAPQQQFSVSCFAVHGKDYAALNPPGVLDFYEEEHWLTVHRPQFTGQVNQILCDALVSHYSFFPQKRLHETDVLERYREIAEKL